jgi:hypothetical protein
MNTYLLLAVCVCCVLANLHVLIYLFLLLHIILMVLAGHSINVFAHCASSSFIISMIPQ